MCKDQKPEQKLPHGKMKPRVIDYPWQYVCTDLMGPFPLSKKRNRYVLVISDMFTKFSLVFPLKAATAGAVAKHLEEDVFLVYGVPQFLLCDNGQQYNSRSLKQLIN